jgi:hypothetical protein
VMALLRHGWEEVKRACLPSACCQTPTFNNKFQCNDSPNFQSCNKPPSDLRNASLVPGIGPVKIASTA